MFTNQSWQPFGVSLHNPVDFDRHLHSDAKQCDTRTTPECRISLITVWLFVAKSPQGCAQPPKYPTSKDHLDQSRAFMPPKNIYQLSDTRTPAFESVKTFTFQQTVLWSGQRRPGRHWSPPNQRPPTDTAKEASLPSNGVFYVCALIRCPVGLKRYDLNIKFIYDKDFIIVITKRSRSIATELATKRSRGQPARCMITNIVYHGGGGGGTAWQRRWHGGVFVWRSCLRRYRS